MQTKSFGLLLQSIPYLGKSQILKIFTEESGLISLMAKNIPFAPFCVAEWVYRKTQGEIFNLIEGSLIDSLIGLRQSYAALMAAGSMARDLLKTQWPAKASPRLYNLAHVYFRHAPLFENPAILSMSFRLKLLLHEGLLALQTQCTYCEEQATALLEGETVCALHATISATQFSILEWQVLCTLALARNISSLRHLDLHHDIVHLPSLEERITSLFEIASF